MAALTDNERLIQRSVDFSHADVDSSAEMPGASNVAAVNRRFSETNTNSLAIS